MEGRMVSWVMELSRCDMKYILRENIKFQVVVDFVVGFSPLADVDMPI